MTLGELLAYEWIVAILVGLGGGILNAVLFGGGFRLPKRTTREDGRTIIDPGFIGTILISAAAAFLTWSYSTDASFSDKERSVKPIAGALVAGIAGSGALSFFVNRQYGEGVTQQTESAAESLATGTVNLVQERDEARKERDEARAVIEELRQQNKQLMDQLGRSGDSTA